MKKTRLNRRINAVRKNIVVKKHLLNKLEKIKINRKIKKPSKVLKKPSKVLKNPSKALKKPSKALKKPSKVLKNPSKALKKPSKAFKRVRNKIQINSIKLPYIKKIRKLNSIFPKSRNNLDNMKNNDTCNFINFHEEHIEIPNYYPGDLWVHHNLVVDRDKPLEYFDEDYLKEVYKKHRKICYGV